MQKNRGQVDLSQRLFIELGTSLYLESENKKESASGKLIGMKVGEYLIVEVSGSESGDRIFKNQGSVKIKYLNIEDIFFFKSKVLLKLDFPDELIFFEYPDSVKSCNIRKHTRVDCFINAEMVSEELNVPGVITNISPRGCRFDIIDKKISKDLYNYNVAISIIYGKGETLLLNGNVRSVHVNNPSAKDRGACKVTCKPG
ncbi:MAG: flagellar brake domain-containing protein [Thermodesulfobacteriota bacterium]|nr:flagellar brake domain-containing protein [Thermodesulfobacteriota bacterium]